MHILALLVCGASLLVPFEQNGKWGFRDSGGTVRVPPRYQAAQPFSAEGIAAVADEKGWAYIDAKGRVLIRPLAVDNGPDYFEEGLARFRRSGRIGFFDRHGKIVIPPKWSHALPFSDGLAAVCEGCAEKRDGEHVAVSGGRWGFIDRRGRLAIVVQFQEAGRFENGRARVRMADAWRTIGTDGRVVP